MRDPLFERELTRAGFTDIRGSTQGTGGERFLDYFEVIFNLELPKWDSEQVLSIKFFGEFKEPPNHFNFSFARATLSVHGPGDIYGTLEPIVEHEFIPGLDGQRPFPTKAEMSSLMLAIVERRVESLDRARQVLLVGQDPWREHRHKSKGRNL
jgi:hypothetical protein